MPKLTLDSPIVLSVSLVVSAVAGTALNWAVITYGPDQLALSALTYGPYSKGAGSMGLTLACMTVIPFINKRWVRVTSLTVFASALLYFSYVISLEMAMASRPDQIPQMVAADVGCFPSRLTDVLKGLDIKITDSTKVCEET